MEYKRCTKCKKIKGLKNFRYRGGLQNECKFCAGLKGDPEYSTITNKEAIQALESVITILNPIENIPFQVTSNLIHINDYLKKTEFILNEETST